jgi:hypothetical protein
VCAATVAITLGGAAWLLRPGRVAVAEEATSQDAACCEAAA